VDVSSPWPTIHAERNALADDLDGLTDAQWSTRSLCGDWTVHQVLGHLVATAKMTPSAFVIKMMGSGFRFSAMTNKNIARETDGPPGATLAEFRRVASRSSSPPGPVDSWLGEILVHGEDIRRPLGLPRSYPMDALERVADFYKGSNLLIGTKKRIAGLTLRSTDSPWSTGDGPVVEGPMLSLLLAMTGRRAALDDLSGDGMTTLRERT
jgi:uncharacterized protein (TIGR03083 family)